MKKIYLTESQFKEIVSYSLFEGVDWNLGNNGMIDMSINNDRSENANRGKNSVDTRVFGTKNDILNSRLTKQNGEERAKSKSLSQKYAALNAQMQNYEKTIEWINNGRNGNLELSDLAIDTKKTILKWINRGDSDRKIMDACKKSMDRISADINQVTMTYNRVSNSQEENKTARYITGIVPQTNVKYISLFQMSDFNFSDAIKHGTVRQNGNTDDLFGINQDERELDNSGNLKTLPITYDGKYSINGDVSKNFSLSGVKDGHFKQQYGLNGEGGYSSVNQFLDKSIMYAAYALKKEKFIPDVIVSVPSSSKFNQYYCTNLSRKLGVPYHSDFFQRDVINIKYANGEDLESKGFSPKDVFEFESQAKNVAYNEIAWIVSQPISGFVVENAEILGGISTEKHSREKIALSDVFDCVMIYAYRTILNSLNDDVLSKHLTQNFMGKQTKLYNKNYDSTRVLQEVSLRLKTKGLMRAFSAKMAETANLVRQYSEQLKTNGYKLRFGLKRFKITMFKKQFRPFLSNIYVVADNYLTNGDLQDRFKNAKFLIFDEDINSGASLKVTINALEDKLPSQSEQNMLCLVNAYSASGF